MKPIYDGCNNQQPLILEVMKKLLCTLGFIFAFGVFTSCSVDDTEPTQSVDEVKMKFMKNNLNSNKDGGETIEDSLSIPPPPPVYNPDPEIDPPKPAPKPEN